MNDLKGTSFDTLRLACVGLAAATLLISPARRAAAAPPATSSVAVEADDQLRQIQTDEETKVLTLGANGSLELKTVSGDVTVVAGSGRDVRIAITRRSRGRSTEDARLGLQRVTVTVDQQGDRAVVATQYPDNGRRDSSDNYSVDVSFNVTAPAGTRVSATSVSGNVRVENIKADVSMNVVSGNVALVGAGKVADVKTISGDVTVTDVAGDSVTLGTVSGNVIIDRTTARQLEAETTSGDVRATSVSTDRATLRSLSGDVVYAGGISKGGRYEFQSHSGNVSFDPTGSVGYDLQAMTFSGTITPPRGMTSNSLSTSRSRAFHGTIGSGGASVSITTFSGNVRVGK